MSSLKESLSKIFGNKSNEDLVLRCKFTCPSCNNEHFFTIHPFYKFGPKTFVTEDNDICPDITLLKANHDKRLISITLHDEKLEIPYTVISVSVGDNKIY